MSAIKPIRQRVALLHFAIYGVLFFLATFYGIPFLETLGWMNILAWFFCGSAFVFLPMLLHALIAAKRESTSGIGERLRLKPLTRTDWLWIAGALVFIGIASGIIMGLNHILAAKMYRATILDMQAPFLRFNGFTPDQRWMLLLWLPSFLLIIFGEEFMWRGLLLPRMEKQESERAWIWNALFWLGFHAAFGTDLMIVMLPVIFVVPYVAWKRKSTTPGLIIHGFYNAAGFLAVALGFISH